jgi:hypothetical protein
MHAKSLLYKRDMFTGSNLSGESLLNENGFPINLKEICRDMVSRDNTYSVKQR